MGCCGGNDKNAGNSNLIKYRGENQTKKKTSLLTWIVLLIVFMLLIFSVLN